MLKLIQPTMLTICVLLVTSCLFLGNLEAQTSEVAVIETNYGTMVLEFWDDVAPKHVENFKKLAKSEFYDGTCFHRIIAGFMIQGGDPLTKEPDKKSQWGTGGPGYTVDAEFNDRKHVRGVLSAARTSDPNSAGSQFFIMLEDSPHLDGKYTAFGKLIEGNDVLAKIAAVEVGGPQGSAPLQRVNVKSVRIVNKQAAVDNDK